jgi:hypothetical protein
MATLQKIGEIILGVAAVCLAVYLKFLSLRNYEETRKHKSGLLGFLKKLD